MMSERTSLLKMLPSSLLNAHIDDVSGGKYGSKPLPPEGEGDNEGHLGKKGRRYVAPTSSTLIEMTRNIIPNKILDGTEHTVDTSTKGRDDALDLEKALNESLEKFQVRPNPVCSSREVMFSETFDELIRQVTLERPERGLLLLRIRDEIRLTIQNHLEIFRETHNFGCEKLARAEVNYKELEDTLTAKQARKKDLTTRLSELQVHLAQVERDNQTTRINTYRNHDKARSKLSLQADTLQRFIQSLDTQKNEELVKKRKRKKKQEVAGESDSDEDEDDEGEDKEDEDEEDEMEKKGEEGEEEDGGKNNKEEDGETENVEEEDAPV